VSLCAGVITTIKILSLPILCADPTPVPPRSAARRGAIFDAEHEARILGHAQRVNAEVAGKVGGILPARRAVMDM
jgi:hypothetical protein